MADNVMAVFQDVDKCMRCNGCTIACKREWGLKNPDTVASILPAGGTPAQTVKPRTRLAIKSQRRSDMGAFVRFSCWHCPSPPCVPACPRGAIKKEASGAVSVDVTKCVPELCKVDGRYPCEWECQRGGYPKIGRAYEAITADKMNKCTLCHGRAGKDDLTRKDMLPTRASAAEILAVPEKAHEPACVSSCPAKAMKWDKRATIVTMLAADYKLSDGTPNWIGDGSMFWGSKKYPLAPPKADPFVEDHVTPMVSGLGAKLVVPTLVLGGIAALSARRNRIQSGEEV